MERKSAKNKSKHSRKKRVTGFEEWGGYMESKKLKLTEQFSDQKDIEIEGSELGSSKIFEGISIYVNGYTKPTAEELKRMMMIHGGRYHYYYSSRTTHMVASNLPNSKIKSLKEQKVVTPNWITDSIEAGKLLPYTDYLLYTPEVTDGQHRLGTKFFQTDKIKRNEVSSTVTDAETSPKNEVNSPKINEVSNAVVEAEISVGNEVNSGESDELNNKNLKTVNINIPVNTCDMSNSLSSNHYAEQIRTPTASVQEDSNSTKSVNHSVSPMKAGHPDFITEFYNHSRLHHISTAGQELKQYVQQLAQLRKGKGFPGRESLLLSKKQNTFKNQLMDENDAEEICFNEFEDCKLKNGKVIMHLDMDCFFVSVGLRKYPELRGQPVAVTHSKGKRVAAPEGSSLEYEANYYEQKRKKQASKIFVGEQDSPEVSHKISKYSNEYGSLSEIASCSYEARQAGLRNGMFLGEALRRCPNLKTIPYDFEGYTEVSKQLYDIVASYTLDIEAVSCDELYIDCTELLLEAEVSALDFATVLRKEIFEKTGCTASAGIGSNMLLARLATRLAKPNGQYLLHDVAVDEFMKAQQVRDLPGVGYTTSSRLECMGIHTCGDLQNVLLSKLQSEFGAKTGQTLYDRCRGKDDKKVTLEKDRKSVSAEINYGIRFEEEDDIQKFICELSNEVQSRLKKIGKKGRAITLKIMARRVDAPVVTAKFMGHGVCENLSKSTVLKLATDDSKIISDECYAMSRILKILPADYRGLGIHVGKLESSEVNKNGIKTLEHFLSKSCATNSDENVTISENSTVIKQVSGSNNNTNNAVSIDSEASQNNKRGIMNFFNETTEKDVDEKRKTGANYIPSINELDQNVMNALPEDIRSEVLSELTKDVNNSPKKGDADCNKVDFKKSAKHSSKTKNAKVAKAKKITTNSQNTLLSFVRTSEPAVIMTSSSPIPESESQASLSGITDINEIKSLIKEWVESDTVPYDEDAEQFKDYILQTVECDLEKTNIILKHLYSLVSASNELWKEVYLSVLSYVQQKVLQNYGYMLEAKSEFPSVT